MGAKHPVTTTQSITRVGFRHIHADCTRSPLRLGGPNESQSKRIPAHGDVVDGCSFPPARSWQGPTAPGRKVTGVRDKNSRCCYS